MTARYRFRKLGYRLLPSWLSTGEGELVHYSLGLLVDAFAERARLAARARFPEYAPPDALSYLGRDRVIFRGIDETDASYATRLVRWLDDHRPRGNPFAMMEQIRAFCNADVRVRTVDQRGNWFTLDRDGSRSYSLDTSNWNWDGSAAALWGKFWVIIYPTIADNRPWDLINWGTFVWGTDTHGTTATPGEVSAVRSIVRKWKPAGTRCEWIVISFDDTAFDPTSPEPDGTWGPWGDGSSPSLPSRLTTARYWDGTDPSRPQF